MSYKMVCIDMDGTLLGKGKKISIVNKNAIKRVHNKGIQIVVTTGRIYNNAEYFSNFLGVNSPVIAANGAIVRDKISNKVIYQNPISLNECFKLIDLLYEMKVFFHFYTIGGIYSSSIITEIGTKIYMTKQVGYENLKIKYHVIKDKKKWKEFFEQNANQITKCIAFSVNPAKIEKLKEKLKDIDGIVYFGSGSRSVEIGNKGVSKGAAVKALAEHYGIKREEIMAIGDNENDMSMIEYAGLGVAMGNAIEPLKEIADYVTSSNVEDGVAKALDKFIK
ncbi:HAD family hydrolase [Caproiciproducens sp. MSJ-32]|uniref:HAD family hydrolase n=1 Tax=Caproiciproducens sp. MSJ-32 TaxID=2841527 RepID=UPI001C107FDF|nr:HAD family hydrolase [Caproiciproducens sp. MSJ-32]MBU5455143.1 Cof-type HAD-IIB family hydrolase [Caproiciproducens sp. MSJ-32]